MLIALLRFSFNAVKNILTLINLNGVNQALMQQAGTGDLLLQEGSACPWVDEVVTGISGRNSFLLDLWE